MKLETAKSNAWAFRNALAKADLGRDCRVGRGRQVVAEEVIGGDCEPTATGGWVTCEVFVSGAEAQREIAGWKPPTRT